MSKLHIPFIVFSASSLLFFVFIGMYGFLFTEFILTHTHTHTHTRAMPKY